MDALSYIIIQQGAKYDKKQKTPIPPTIEHIAGYDDQYILYLKVLLEDEPIEQEYQRQEKQEFQGVEKQRSWFFR